MAYVKESWKVPHLSLEEMETLIEGYRLYRYEGLSVGAALGIRAAFRALAELQVERKNREKTAVVVSGYCFAQAVEYICAVSHLRDKMEFTPSMDHSKTSLVLKSESNQVRIEMMDSDFGRVEEVLQADDEALFKLVECTEL